MAERSKMEDLLSLYIPSFFIFVGAGIVSPVLSIYAKDFGVNFAMVSLAVSLYSVGRLVMDFPAGILAERYGRRQVMLVGTAILMIFSFLNANAPNFWVFLLFRFLQGMGSGMWMTSRQTLLADMLKPEERGRTLGYFYSITLIGQVAGPTIGGFVAQWFGLRANFYFYSLTSLISLILTWSFIQEPKVHHAKHASTGFHLDVMKRLLKNRGFMFAAFATTTTAILAGVRQTTIPLFASTIIHLNSVDIGIVLSVATAMNLILTVPMGYAIDNFGRKPIVVFALCASAVSCFIYPSTSTFLLMCGASAIMGIGSSGSNQAPVAMATDATVNEPHGVSMGLFRMFSDIGGIIGPIILGMVADSFGITTPFYVMAVILLVNASIIFFFGRETFSKKTGLIKSEEAKPK